MRKKIFTLLTLMLMSIGSAWADGITYKSDFADNTAIWLTQGYVDEVASSGSYWIAKGGKLTSVKNLKGKKFIDPTTNEVAADAQYSSDTNFYVEKAYNSDNSKDQSLYIYVTGVAKMYFYAWDNGSLDGRTMNISVNGEDAGVITFSNGSQNAQYTSVLLDRTVNNTIRINGSNEVLLVAIKPVLNITATAFEGVKEGNTKLTLTTDYTIDDATKTITLTEAHKVASPPTNIKLIKRMTFSDSSTSDEDVSVTFGATATAGYFTSSSTIAIGSDNYTVKVPYDVTPTLSLDETSGSIILKSYEPITSKVVKLSGGNLTDGTYDAPTAVGITVTPSTFTVSGGTLIDEEFTITPSASASASTVLTFTVGTASVDYTLGFSQPAQGSATEVMSVSTATTWDWTKAGNEVTEVKLTDSTNPTRETEFILSNLPEINNDANFNSAALKVKVEYPVRDGKYMQGGYVTLKTTVSGTIAVTFTNTGSSNNDRCLTVDGALYPDVVSGKSNSNGQVTKTVFVNAGTHVLSGAQISDEAPNYLRFYKIIFNPCEIADITDAGWATLYTGSALDFSGVSGLTAYTATCSENTVTLTPVNDVPANTGVVLRGDAGSYTIPVATSSTTDKGDLIGSTTEATAYNAYNGFTLYMLNKVGDKAQFVPVTEGSIAAGKAFLKVSANSARELSVVVNGETTGIAEANENQNENRYYDLSGRRVVQPTKGLYIVNGRKFVVK